MKLKPKSTTLQPKALLYKRFIGIEKSLAVETIYNTISDGFFWTFDSVSLSFEKFELEIPQGTKVIKIEDFASVLQFQKTFFRYTGLGWEKIDDITNSNIVVLSATFNNIAKYQTNKYYFCGSFDFVIKGSGDETTTQFIKGNIMPLESINIKHFNDDIKIMPDDLVVINGKLYSVENTSTDHKFQPKDFRVYFATLNSVL
jgi:hypothetical protein